MAHRYGFDSPPGIDPAPLLATLRAEEPVARVRTPYGDESWLITRYASVKAALHDPRLSRAAAVALGPRIPRVSTYVNRGNYLTRFDPPEHGWLRHLVTGPFSNREVQRHRPRAEEIADQVADEMISAGPPADLIAGFARPFPMISLGEFIGIPMTERDPSLKITRPTVFSRAASESEVLIMESRQQQRIRELLASRRERPQNDLTTALLQSQQGTNPSTDEALRTLMHDLATNGSVGVLLTNVLHLLLTHPDHLAWLRANLDGLPHALEELLRFVPLGPDSPGGAQGHVRVATEDLEIDGVLIRTGDCVLPTISSANRDERAFTHPDRLDMTRAPNPHIAFGFGTHNCPGAAISRMQLEVAINTVLTRFPHLEMAIPEHEVPWRKDLGTRMPERLPVTW